MEKNRSNAPRLPRPFSLKFIDRCTVGVNVKLHALISSTHIRAGIRVISGAELSFNITVTGVAVI